MSGTYDDMAGADEPQPEFADPGDPLEQSLTQSGVGLQPEQQMPVYKMMPQSRIPVSSKRGPLWKSRKDSVQKQMGDLIDAWDEAIRYYNHDQSSHRDGNSTPDYAGNRYIARRLNDKFSSTENVVFSNINAQVPELYAKNPIISVTSEPTGDAGTGNPANVDNDAYARAVERLVNVLFGMKTAPGVNIKPKAKKNVLIALLTNHAWFEVGYVTKDKSSDQAMEDLVRLSNELREAEDQEDIEEAEASLVALEEKVEFLQPSGPFVRVRMPHQVLVDPDHCDPFLGDAQWVMIEDMLATQYINSVFGMPDTDDSEEIKSIYEPTHILNGGSSGSGGDNDEFTLFDKTNNTYSAYGFDTQTAYESAKRTKVWYIWDKSTRRLEMYADNDWKWPIWVWDDPYLLQGFFPLVPMWFHDSPTSVFTKGEVSYYLDQQDQINEINDEKRRAILWARRNIFFNPNAGITQDIADDILNGPRAMAVPVNVPDGVDPQKILFSIPPPSVAFHQLFDKTDLYASVDRITASNEVERGGQFKTNTTNKAIDYYSTMGNLRMDMRLDAIEDALGDVGWKVAQLCLRYMDKETVQQLTGLDVSTFWKPLDGLRDFAQLSVSCVGGSTQKLTSQGRKQEAVQVGQILAQFVKAAPATVLKSTLDMFSKAFDDFLIQKEDWDQIEAEVERTLVAGQGGAPGVGVAGGGIPQQPGAQPGAPPAAPGGGMMQIAQMVTQALERLPPQMLRAIGNALAQGIPPQQILQQMMQATQGSPTPIPASPQGAAA
jgi:hypothetical protein